MKTRVLFLATAIALSMLAGECERNSLQGGG